MFNSVFKFIKNRKFQKTLGISLYIGLSVCCYHDIKHQIPRNII